MSGDETTKWAARLHATRPPVPSSATHPRPQDQRRTNHGHRAERLAHEERAEDRRGDRLEVGERRADRRGDPADAIVKEDAGDDPEHERGRSDAEQSRPRRRDDPRPEDREQEERRQDRVEEVTASGEKPARRAERRR
jgi:hypothetical protein